MHLEHVPHAGDYAAVGRIGRGQFLVTERNAGTLIVDDDVREGAANVDAECVFGHVVLIPVYPELSQ
jgi:hypothetical protein